MRSAVVTLATEEVATREIAARLASSLGAAARASTLIWVSENSNCAIPPPVMAGVDVVTISAAAPGRAWFPDYPLLNLTRQIAPTLREFEVVYGLTSGHPLMHAICEGRHAPGRRPIWLPSSTPFRPTIGIQASVRARLRGDSARDTCLPIAI